MGQPITHALAWPKNKADWFQPTSKKNQKNSHFCGGFQPNGHPSSSPKVWGWNSWPLPPVTTRIMISFTREFQSFRFTPHYCIMDTFVEISSHVKINQSINQRKKVPRTNWTGAFEKRKSLRMVLPLSPASFHIFSRCQTSKPFSDVWISKKNQPTRSPKYLLRSQVFRHTPSKIHFQWSMKGHTQPWRLKLPNATLHFSLLFLLNSPSKKKRYLNKTWNFTLPWLPMVLSSATPQNKHRHRPPTLQVDQGTFQQAIELVDTHLTWHADWGAYRWFPNWSCGAPFQMALNMVCKWRVGLLTT